MRICKIEGCNGAHSARGWCKMHYARWERRGDPMLAASLDAMSAEERIERNMIPEPNSGCWIWLSSVSDHHREAKYHRAQMRFGGTSVTVARLSYATYRGEIPEGLHVLHRCDTPLCVNPDHLWLGTHLDNMRDRARKRASRQITA